MGHYLLATYAVAGEVPGAPHSPEEMQAFMQRLVALEAEMDEAGAFLFSGGLLDPDAATVVGPGDGEVREGTFPDGAAQIAGFYIINADGGEVAQAWASKVAAATKHPIELRPFAATGKVADHMGSPNG